MERLRVIKNERRQLRGAGGEGRRELHREKPSVLRMVRALVWYALRVPPRELRLDLTLSNGQCFGWQRSPSDESTWIGVVGPRVVALRQTEEDCLFRCLGTARTAAPVRADDAEALVRAELSDLFQLDRFIAPMREEWSASDPRMQSVCAALSGMRILRQDPVECLFSFICSSNNNIGRITGMLQAIRRTYGERIPLSEPAVDGLRLSQDDFFAFPTAAALAAASETELRDLGLGYRAPYVLKTAETLVQRGDGWLGALRTARDPAYVRSELCGLMGVGPKVADCVALFSLDQADAIPVDTHVWTIACREYDSSLRSCASLTPEVYGRVGALFRSRYGSHAGWAHSVLFAAELPQFSRFLPVELQDELKRNAAAEREQKKRDREEAGRRRIAKAEAKAAKQAEAQAAAEQATAQEVAGGEREGDEPPALRRTRGSKRQPVADLGVRTPVGKTNALSRRRAARTGHAKDGGDGSVSSAACSEEEAGLTTVVASRHRAK
eukprot:scaffold23168_cov125-Isochrysis_galbana.AAC.3